MRRIRRKILTFIIGILTLFIVYKLSIRDTDLIPVTVNYVVDGDTLYVHDSESEYYVRLIGVDTPESVNPDESKNIPQGTVASQYTKSLISSGDTVWIEYDLDKTDDYDRQLCYVYLTEDGETMLQEELLKTGMACVLTVSPNVKYVTTFMSLEAEAKANNVGFWAEGIWE